MRTARPIALVLIVLSFAWASAASPAGARPKPKAVTPPMAVVALIDSGINPYAAAFRDRSPLAYRHPSTYIPGYPKGARELRLTLDVPYERALERDRRTWTRVRPETLYWIPGTRIVGAISMASGGTSCPVVPVPPANAVNQTSCEDFPILDGHGHGTMTASRAAGRPNSLAPYARIVEVEGLGAASVRWAADQGWIDVQSNSWIDLIPPPVNGLVGDTSAAFAYASTRTLTLAASGNGSAYILGVAPTPTYVLSTAPPGVILVGGHDNGRMTLWSGSPPHVVADSYAGYAALRTSSGPMVPDSIACCSSAASPYAAGAAAAIVDRARKILGDHRTGIHDGVVARGPAGRVKAGPLADGMFTLDELRSLFLHTAEARPAEGRDDGLVHWTGEPRAPELTPFGPGANPFCQGCWTTPVSWEDIPAEGPTYPLLGYGAINERSLVLALRVLSGTANEPERPQEDQAFDLDQQLRALIFGSG